MSENKNNYGMDGVKREYLRVMSLRTFVLIIVIKKRKQFCFCHCDFKAVFTANFLIES